MRPTRPLETVGRVVQPSRRAFFARRRCLRTQYGTRRRRTGVSGSEWPSRLRSTERAAPRRTLRSIRLITSRPSIAQYNRPHMACVLVRGAADDYRGLSEVEDDEAVGPQGCPHLIISDLDQASEAHSAPVSAAPTGVISTSVPFAWSTTQGNPTLYGVINLPYRSYPSAAQLPTRPCVVTATLSALRGSLGGSRVTSAESAAR